MSLTAEEKTAVLGAKYFGDYWGEKDLGFCPAAIVAQMRGIRFVLDEETNCYRINKEDPYSDVQQAAADISTWLGINGSTAFYDTLTAEREKILDRAPKE